MAIIEHPILFSGEMVKAILDGRKTMTRRVVKPQPIKLDIGAWFPSGHPGDSKNRTGLHYANEHHFRKGFPIDFSPYGQLGDRLWVRETWKIASFMEGDPMLFQYRADGGEAEENDHYDELKYEGWFERVCIQSTDYLEKIKWPNKNDDGIYSWDNGKSPLPWRPAIFMPRWASRINLEIVSVKVERVQEITWQEVIPEGIGASTVSRGVLSDNPPNPRWKFIEVWNKINAKRGFGWDINPWVWVIEFKRVTP